MKHLDIECFVYVFKNAYMSTKPDLKEDLSIQLQALIHNLSHKKINLMYRMFICKIKNIIHGLLKNYSLRHVNK